jgi:hypothetical protein
MHTTYPANLLDLIILITRILGEDYKFLVLFL